MEEPVLMEPLPIEPQPIEPLPGLVAETHGEARIVEREKPAEEREVTVSKYRKRVIANVKKRNMLRTCVIPIQAMVRCKLARREAKLRKQAVIKVQSRSRAHLASKQVGPLKRERIERRKPTVLPRHRPAQWTNVRLSPPPKAGSVKPFVLPPAPRTYMAPSWTGWCPEGDLSHVRLAPPPDAGSTRPTSPAPTARSYVPPSWAAVPPSKLLGGASEWWTRTKQSPPPEPGSARPAALDSRPSGLRWMLCGDTMPTAGTELVHPALALALMEATEFTAARWSAFGISRLRADHFVKSDEGYYFKPVDGMLPPRREALFQGATHWKFDPTFSIRSSSGASAVWATPLTASDGSASRFERILSKLPSPLAPPAGRPGTPLSALSGQSTRAWWDQHLGPHSEEAQSTGNGGSLWPSRPPSSCRSPRPPSSSAWSRPSTREFLASSLSRQSPRTPTLLEGPPSPHQTGSHPQWAGLFYVLESPS